MTPDTLSIFERLHYYHRFWRYWRRTEPDAIRFINEELKRGGVAFDIGANKGIISYFLGKRTGESGKVYAFEPQPEMRAQISRVARSFKLQNVEVHSIALSDNDGEGTLFCGEPGQTANMVASGSWQSNEILVPTQTLDSFVKEHQINKVDFIKCDVDGFESKVLRGAIQTLNDLGPKVLIEISEQNLAEIAKILGNQGYDDGIFWHSGKRYAASKTDTVPYRHSEARWRNFLFCKK